MNGSCAWKSDRRPIVQPNGNCLRQPVLLYRRMNITVNCRVNGT
jgi:hypothetical protein